MACLNCPCSFPCSFHGLYLVCYICLIGLLRSPRNFDSILGLYRTGKLHLSQGVSHHPYPPLTAALQSDDSCLVTFTFFLLQLMSLSYHILSFLLVFFWNMMLHKNDPFCQKVWDHPVIPTSTIRWLHLLLNFAFNLLTEHPTQKLSDSSKSMFDLCHLIVVIPNYVGLCYPLKKIRTKVNIIAIVQRFEIQMSWKNCARYLWNYGNLTDGLF